MISVKVLEAEFCVLIFSKNFVRSLSLQLPQI